MKDEKPLRLGTKTPWGEIAAVGILHGPPPERYYWMVRRGDVAMMPASVVEDSGKDRGKEQG